MNVAEIWKVALALVGSGAVTAVVQWIKNEWNGLTGKKIAGAAARIVAWAVSLIYGCLYGIATLHWTLLPALALGLVTVVLSGGLYNLFAKK